MSFCGKNRFVGGGYLMFILRLTLLPFVACVSTPQSLDIEDTESLQAPSEHAAGAVPKAASLNPYRPLKSMQRLNSAKPRWLGKPTLWIWTLDVNQGSAMILLTPSRKHMIIVDTGPDKAGTKAILPFIESLREQSRGNPKQLDMLILTHYDADHIGGADEVLKEIRTLEVFDHGDYDVWSKRRHLNAYRSVQKSQPMQPGFKRSIDGVTIECIASNNITSFDQAKRAPDKRNDNPNSIALVISYGDFSLYVAGDQTGSTEEAMIGKLEPVDLFIVNHHGSSSKGSNSEGFLQMLNPKIAIASMGKHKGYKHPKPAPLSILSEIGSKVFFTNRNEHSAYQQTEETVGDWEPKGYEGHIGIEVPADLSCGKVHIGAQRAFAAAHTVYKFCF
jgi:competence protein ComEC